MTFFVVLADWIESFWRWLDDLTDSPPGICRKCLSKVEDGRGKLCDDCYDASLW